jgi:hypothetical protein
MPHATHIVPPWSPKYKTLPSDDIKGRRTWKLLSKHESPDADPEYLEATKQLGRALRRGDSDGAKKLQKRLEEIAQKQRREYIQRVLADHSNEIHKGVVNLYLAKPHLPEEDDSPTSDASLADFKKYEVEMASWHARLGVHMGQVSMKDGRPAADELLVSTLNGSCHRAGLLLTFDFLSFERADQGAPAFARWLSQHGCKGFRYALNSGFDIGDSGEFNGEEQ